MALGAVLDDSVFILVAGDLIATSSCKADISVMVTAFPCQGSRLLNANRSIVPPVPLKPIIRKEHGILQKIFPRLAIYMVALDHIIFSLQRTGGISRWWAEHSSRIMGILGGNVDHVGPYINSSCILCEYEELKRLPLSYRNYFERFARVSLSNSIQVFHSSYYRNPDTRWRHAVVCTFHDSARLGGYSLGALARRHVIRRALTRADIIHCVSRESAMQLRLQFPEIPQERVRVVYHGVNRVIPVAIDRLKLTTGQFVLWIGKRLGYKNGIITYHALKQVPDVDLVFVGGEAPLACERELIERLGIADRVHYLGYVSTSELAWAYVHAVAMWYTLTIEGFGMPVIEAAAYGCPAITSSAPAIQEIGGGWAIMTETPTPEWIADATFRVSSGDTRRVIANQGKKLADRFSWDIYTQKMLNIYQELGQT